MEGANEHFIDGTKENLFQYHVNCNIFLEKRGGFGKGVADSGGCGASGIGRNLWLCAWIGWWFKRNGRERVVDGVGYGEG